MRLLFALLLLPAPAAAWEFTPAPICTLSHQTAEADITITKDVSLPEYALFITLRNGDWADAPSFRMVFGGGREIDIGTTAHELSGDGKTLSVRDRGFGNVLDGLEFNQTVLSMSGNTGITADLADAPPAVRAFRACPSDDPATS